MYIFSGIVLQGMTSTLNVIISVLSDPVQFADAAYSAGFITEQVKLDSMSSVSTAYVKVSKILSAVKNHITQQATCDDVCRKFDQFVILLHDQLKMKDLARQLVEGMRECYYLEI